VQAVLPPARPPLPREVLEAPKAAFARLLLSHIVRHAWPALTPRDLVRVVRLMSDAARGGELPKPWAQDAALRALDAFGGSLLGEPPRRVPATQYWHGAPLLDLAYTGEGAPPATSRPLPPDAAASGYHRANATVRTGTAPGRPWRPGAWRPALSAADFADDGGSGDCGTPISEARVRWAYGSVHSIVQNAETLRLGALQARHALLVYT
jgi:hypothetical protein